MRGWIRVSTVAPGLAFLLVPATVQDVVLLAMASLVLPLAAYWLAGRVPKVVEPKVGFEPTTVGLRNRCSTPELLRRGARRDSTSLTLAATSHGSARRGSAVRARQGAPSAVAPPWLSPAGRG
jgi:hypothetical protein